MRHGVALLMRVGGVLLVHDSLRTAAHATLTCHQISDYQATKRACYPDCRRSDAAGLGPVAGSEGTRGPHRGVAPAARRNRIRPAGVGSVSHRRAGAIRRPGRRLRVGAGRGGRTGPGVSGHRVVLRIVGGACLAGGILAGAGPGGGVRVESGCPVLQFAERGPVHLRARGRRVSLVRAMGVFQRMRRGQLVDAGRAGNRRTELGAGSKGRLHDRGYVVCVGTAGKRQQGHRS